MKSVWLMVLIATGLVLTMFAVATLEGAAIASQAAIEAENTKLAQVD